MTLLLFFSVIFLLSIYANSFAAVGCSLDDPDRDVKRLFPESSGYLSKFITLKEIGGQGLQNKLEEKLGDKFDVVYEDLDVPYVYYTILKGKDNLMYGKTDYYWWEKKYGKEEANQREIERKKN